MVAAQQFGGTVVLTSLHTLTEFMISRATFT